MIAFLMKVVRRAVSCVYGTWVAFASFAALAPAILPKVMVSEIELPPSRFVPWTPPVTSPAS